VVINPNINIFEILGNSKSVVFKFNDININAVHPKKISTTNFGRFIDSKE
jgi:hypothetical protein